jgi:hypothetical protein
MLAIDSRLKQAYIPDARWNNRIRRLGEIFNEALVDTQHFINVERLEGCSHSDRPQYSILPTITGVPANGVEHRANG